jgi:hypothetical protein
MSTRPVPSGKKVKSPTSSVPLERAVGDSKQGALAIGANAGKD